MQQAVYFNSPKLKSRFFKKLSRPKLSGKVNTRICGVESEFSTLTAKNYTHHRKIKPCLYRGLLSKPPRLMGH